MCVSKCICLCCFYFPFSLLKTLDHEIISPAVIADTCRITAFKVKIYTLIEKKPEEELVLF